MKRKKENIDADTQQLSSSLCSPRNKREIFRLLYTHTRFGKEGKLRCCRFSRSYLRLHLFQWCNPKQRVYRRCPHRPTSTTGSVAGITNRHCCRTARKGTHFRTQESDSSLHSVLLYPSSRRTSIQNCFEQREVKHSQKTGVESLILDPQNILTHDPGYARGHYSIAEK